MRVGSGFVRVSVLLALLLVIGLQVQESAHIHVADVSASSCLPCSLSGDALQVPTVILPTISRGIIGSDISVPPAMVSRRHITYSPRAPPINF